MSMEGTSAADDHTFESQLWEQLHSAGPSAQQARESLIEFHTPYARAIAAKLYSGRFRDDVPFEDYFQFACVGLIEAIDRYDPAAAAQFRTFANLRIKGAVLDGLEGMTEQRQQNTLVKRLKAQRIRSLTDGSGGESLKSLKEDELLVQLAEIGIGAALSYLIDHAATVGRETEHSQVTPYASDQLAQLKRNVAQLVEQLSAQERKVITMHYYHETPFETIANQMELTKGRISQIHKQALLRLKTLASAQPPGHRAW